MGKSKLFFSTGNLCFLRNLIFDVCRLTKLMEKIQGRISASRGPKHDRKGAPNVDIIYHNITYQMQILLDKIKIELSKILFYIFFWQHFH